MRHEPLLDPDCRAGKHQSCAGWPCECACHEQTGAVLERTREALHTAFTIIVNADHCLSPGTTDELRDQWKEAATRFVNDYNDNLSTYIGKH